MLESERQKSGENLKFLWASGNLYAEKNPKLSKYFISIFHRLSSSKTMIDGQALTSLYCPHCFSLMRPDNHAARLLPKLCISRRLTRIKHKASKHGLETLSKGQASQLRRWEDSQTKLSMHCSDCQSTVKIPGSKRRINQPKHEGRRKVTAKRRLQQQQDGQQLKGNKQRTPVTPKRDFLVKQGQFNSKYASQLLTPTSQGFGASPSTMPPGTASARKACHLNKKKHQQLQRMLDGARREKANSQSPLKDFLVSL